MTATQQLPGRPVEAFAGLRVIDADTHLTEPHDLWTSLSLIHI